MNERMNEYRQDTGSLWFKPLAANDRTSSLRETGEVLPKYMGGKNRGMTSLEEGEPR